jgi:hypothetical protein
MSIIQIVKITDKLIKAVKVIVVDYLKLSILIEHASILKLALDFIPVYLYIGHIDDHDVVKQVNVIEITFKLVQFLLGFL